MNYRNVSTRGLDKAAEAGLQRLMWRGRAFLAVTLRQAA